MSHSEWARSAVAVCATIIAAYVLMFIRNHTSNQGDQRPYPYHVGVAWEDITPTYAMPLAGFSSRNGLSSTGVLQHLRVTALIIGYPNTRSRSCIVSYDLIGMHSSLAERVYDSLWHKFHLSRNETLLVFSHTHSGPVVGRNLEVLHDLNATSVEAVQRYAEELLVKTVAAVSLAERDVQKFCSLHYVASEMQLGTNRRNNVEAQFAGVHQTVGPVDHDLSILAVRERRNGRLFAIAFSYAAHGTVLTSEMRYSNDWMGFARMYIEEQFGPGVVALFIPGCGGDINVLPRGALIHAEQHGRAVADAVKKRLLDGTEGTELRGALRCSAEKIFLPYARRTHRRERLRFLAAKGEATPSGKLARILLRDAPQLSENFFLGYDYPIMVRKLCSDATNFRLVALGGEAVVDYALRIKRQLVQTSGASSLSRPFVAAYAGDVMGYVPSRAVAEQGGYEAGERSAVLYGLPGTWGPNTEDLIIAAVLRMETRLAAT